eukprot:scaffold97274_cov75-Phaeocystis_antarctica.AAC.1
MKKKFTGANTPWGVSERPWTTAEATRLPPQRSVTASSTSAHDAHSALPRRGLTHWRTGGLDGALGSGGRRLRGAVAMMVCRNQAALVNFTGEKRDGKSARRDGDRLCVCCARLRVFSVLFGGLLGTRTPPIRGGRHLSERMTFAAQRRGKKRPEPLPSGSAC